MLLGGGMEGAFIVCVAAHIYISICMWPSSSLWERDALLYVWFEFSMWFGKKKKKKVIIWATLNATQGSLARMFKNHFISTEHSDSEQNSAAKDSAHICFVTI